MAFANWGAHNYEVEVPLSIEYSRSVVEAATGSYSTQPQYCYTRRARKTYRYKGMTEAAVKECLVAKRAQYTRRFAGWRRQFTRMVQLPRSGDYYDQVAAFTVNRNTVVFDLRIEIDELVNIYSLTNYDLMSANGRDALEAQFQRSSAPLCYVYQYRYDEPGET